jgi:DNA-binding IclR family transcriptional regulator
MDRLDLGLSVLEELARGPATTRELESRFAGVDAASRATLYRTLKSLEAAAWIEETAAGWMLGRKPMLLWIASVDRARARARAAAAELIELSGTGILPVSSDHGLEGRATTPQGVNNVRETH